MRRLAVASEARLGPTPEDERRPPPSTHPPGTTDLSDPAFADVLVTELATTTTMAALTAEAEGVVVPRLKAAIEAAKEAGVDESAITMAEKALKAAGGA